MQCKDLTACPTLTSSNTIQVYLDRNAITELASTCFDAQTRLSSLHLDRNKITELTSTPWSTLFEKLTSLTHLYVALDAARLCGCEGFWVFVGGCPCGCPLFMRCVMVGGTFACQQQGE